MEDGGNVGYLYDMQVNKAFKAAFMKISGNN